MSGSSHVVRAFSCVLRVRFTSRLYGDDKNVQQAIVANNADIYLDPLLALDYPGLFDANTIEKDRRRLRRIVAIALVGLQLSS